MRALASWAHGRLREAPGIVVLLVAGALLRLLFVAAWRPGFMGWPDAASYIIVAGGDLFGNPLRPAGYPLLLRGLHEVWASLNFVIAVNHVMGLATALVLYCAVVRAGAPRTLALLPAAVVALGGDQVFLEHSPLSETPFAFLVATALYAGVRTLEHGSLAWSALAGLLLAAATTVRVVALPLLAVVALWMLLAVPGRFRRRLAVSGAATAAAVGLLATYLLAADYTGNHTSLSRNGVWNTYGRVAPFADCSRFDPPRGTEVLCEHTPRRSRPITAAYTFNWWHSPAVRHFDGPHAASPEETAKVAAFTRAVILNQPLDYISEVGASMARYVAPEALRGYGGGPSYRDLAGPPILLHLGYQREGQRVASRYYTDGGEAQANRGLLRALRGYESVTRIQGPLFLALALLSVSAPFLLAGRARAAAWLFALSAWTLLTVPVATVEFSARSAVPGFGALAAGAALGGWGVALAWQRRRSAKQTPHEAVAEPLAEAGRTDAPAAA